MTILTFLRPVMRPYRRIYYSLPVLDLLGLAAGLSAPFVQQKFIDTISGRGPVWQWTAAMLLCAGITAVTADIARYLDERLKAKVLKDLKAVLIENILNLPGDFFARHRSGYLAARIETDTSRMDYFYSRKRWLPGIYALSMIIAYAILWAKQWQLALILTAVAPVYLFLLKNFRRVNYQLNLENSEARAVSFGSLREIIGNIRTVKAHARETVAGKEVMAHNQKLLSINLKIIRHNTLLKAAVRCIPALVKMAILIFGIIKIRNGEFSLGQLWALLGYTAMVFSPILALTGMMMEREAARSAADRVLDLVKRLPEDNLTDGIIPERLNGNVEVRNVSFGYHDHRPVLTDLSFVANAGEKIAVVGGNGSGKTTLLSLLLRLYKPQKGEIFFDGIAASCYNLRALRSRIGYVCQSPQFFPGTLAQNLSESASVEEISATLQMVGASGLIDRLTEPVSEAMQDFSSGERVKIALARELLRHPDIFILDEPTANLEADAEAEIMNLFIALLRRKTVFLITHNEQLPQYCDKTICIDKHAETRDETEDCPEKRRAGLNAPGIVADTPIRNGT